MEIWNNRQNSILSEAYFIGKNSKQNEIVFYLLA